jgi:hypothetical protein
MKLGRLGIIIRNTILGDLKELENCGNQFLLDSTTGLYSPDGWLAHKAGVGDFLLRDWPILWGTALSRTAKYYGCSFRTFSRLSFWMRKSMGTSKEPVTILARAREAVKDFKFEAQT